MSCPTKPPVPILCNESINRISYKTRQDEENFTQTPGKLEKLCEVQGRCGLTLKLASHQQEHCIECGRIEAMLAKDLLTESTLQRRKAQRPFRVVALVLQNELHSAITQIAMAIEE